VRQQSLCCWWTVSGAYLQPWAVVAFRGTIRHPLAFAHGFWNPCDLKFDTGGRLLATDNDPDSRGPNRVLHIIQGGRYGYKSRFGNSGLHPYNSWNGELPGTLPMIAGVGEAPVGVLDCYQSALPTSFADDLLVGVWGTNEVVRVRTRRADGTITGEVQPLLRGDAHFRPTGIVATSDGTVYIGDWADRQYPVHGMGRIWRLRAKGGVETFTPMQPFDRTAKDPAALQLQRVTALAAANNFDALVSAAQSKRPFIATAAIVALADPRFRDQTTALLRNQDQQRRLVGLLASRQAGVRVKTDQLSKLICDPHPTIRKMAMIWSGETMRMDIAGMLRDSLPRHISNADQFETFLATSQLLTDDEVKRVRDQAPGNRIDRSIDQTLIRSVVMNQHYGPDAQAMAVRFLAPADDSADGSVLVDRLIELAKAKHPTLTSESIRTLSLSTSDAASRFLMEVVTDPSFHPLARCEAIYSLDAASANQPTPLLNALSDSHPEVALSAARVLTSQAHQPHVRDALRAKLDSVDGDANQFRLVNQIRFALRQDTLHRPATDSQWAEWISDGDTEAGRRAFYDSRLACAKCHRHHGRGGRIGPDLSNLASAKMESQS